MITTYEHHGSTVSVQEENKGKHRDNCLCFQGCRHFKPGTSENCQIAQAVYRNCVEFDIVTPVWACPQYTCGCDALPERLS
jgi:hypothetical protein